MTQCLKYTFLSFCFSTTSSFRDVGCIMFGTRYWRDKNWKRNRFVQGRTKINCTSFRSDTHRNVSANNNYKKCTRFLECNEKWQFEGNTKAYWKWSLLMATYLETENGGEVQIKWVCPRICTLINQHLLIIYFL